MFKQRCFRLLLLASAIAISLSAAAYSFESAGIYYNITGNNTVEVTYSDINNSSYSGSISVPETVTNNGTEYSVTTIGESAFKGSAVTSVSMPEGITSIDYNAFSGCQNLETVALLESLTIFGFRAFESCKLLKTIKIPSGVTAIPGSCFYCCSSLESVTIPVGVMTIGQYAFLGCNLKELTLPSTVTMIGSRAFDSNNRFQSITCNATTPPSLGENAFNHNISTTVKVPLSSIAAYRQAEGWKNFSNYCSGEVVNNGITYRIDENGAMVAVAEATLTEANIPSFVEFEGNQYPVIKINDRVFSGNTNLTAVTLPDGLVEIGASAFLECQNLESVVLPESLTTLGDYAFSSCKSLRAVKIPSGVTTIPDHCFYGCSSLESVTIPEGVTAIGDYAFGYCNLNALTLPESLEKIGGYAFTGNKSLKSVNIPAKVKTIETQAFNSCGLTNLVIPEGVQTIGYNTFGRNSLQNLTLPSTVTSIGGSAFGNNNNLQSIICNAVTPPTLDGDAFSIGITPSIKVPMASIAAYRKAYGWKDFSNYYSGEVVADGITYHIDENGAMVAVAETALTEANIHSSVEFEGNQYPVIKINEKVFSGNTNLTVVTLPDGLVEIGNNAFYGCKNLESVTLPESLTTLGSYAFSSCKSLKTIKISSGVTAIPDHCFYECSSLESIAIPEGVTDIGNEAFSGCNLNALTLPESLETIEIYAFCNNSSLKSVNIPAKVKTIEESAFTYCGLTELVIPEGVTTIGQRAFFNNSLQNLTLPSTITSIGKGAFSCYSSYLQSIICNAITPPTLGENAIGSSVKEIKVPISSIAAYKQANGWKDFTNYYGGDVVNNGITYRINEKEAMVAAAEATLTEANIPSFVEFEGNQYPVIKINDNVFADNTNLTAVTLPESLTTLGSRSFESCQSLKTIKIPSGVTTIPYHCFYGCSSLDSVTIPEGVTTIGDGAFFSCNLKELTLPSTVTMVGSDAFIRKNRFQSITCNATTPPNLGENVFGYNASTTVKVPLQSIAAYRQAVGWKNFANYYGGEVVADGITYRIDENGATITAAEATLTEANIPSSVEFEGNQYPVTKINEKVFSGNTNLESVTLPESLTTLGSRSFESCQSLKTIKIPSGVTTIPFQCFLECSSLESVTIPEGVTTIGGNAFFGCSLKELTLPSTITTIGSQVFTYKNRFQTITCNAVTPPTLGDNAFDNDITPGVKVPLQSIVAYRQAVGWKNFANYYGGEVIADGITYRIDDNGAMVAAAEATLTEANIPSSVEFEGNQYPVIKINDRVFSGNTNLTTVTLPESLTTLGSYAFSSCKSLKTIKISSGVTAIPDHCFYECSSLDSVTIPEGVTTIGDRAFEDCNLNALTLPESLEAIGSIAFCGNRSLKSVNIPAKVKTIESYAFFNCGLTELVIPEGVLVIDQDAFLGNYSLKNLTLPSTITSIGESAFLYNYNLQSIICNAVTPPTLGDNAFDNDITPGVKVPLQSIVAYRQAVGWKNFANYYGGEMFADGITYWINEKGAMVAAADSSLTEADIPSVVEFEGNQYLVTKINDMVFLDNTNLESVALPESLTTLGIRAFGGCKSLKTIKIPSKVTAIPDRCFVYCSSLESVTIPEGVTTIGSYAFQSCKLNALTLPESLETIGSYAFSFCDLTDLVIPEGVQTIDNYAFEYNSLKNLTLPSTVTSIGGSAFGNNNNLQSIICNAATPPTLGDNAFRSNISIKVPMASIVAYRQAEGWKNFTNYYGGEVVADGITYRIDENGAMVAAAETSLTEANIPSAVEFEGNQYAVTKINDKAFSDNTNLTAVTLPESVVTLGSDAFSGCQSLKTIKIPSKVTAIPDRCFVSCTSLESVIIPEGVTTVGLDAFYSCDLNTLTLPSTITKIDDGVFSHNNNLRTITCNAVTPPMLGDNVFYYSATSSVKVPLQSIAAYRQADGWKNISEYYVYEVISDGVTYRIDDKAAYVRAVDKTVSEICLAENVAFEGAQYPLYKIADNAFAGNGSITLVTVPATVETIGSNAFDGVTYPIIKIKATTPPVLASKLPMLSAIVPPASVKAYKAANYWKEMTIIGEGKNDIEVTTSATVDLTEAIMTQAKITPASVTSIKVHGPLTNDDIINALNTNMRSCYAIDLSDAEIEALPDEAFNGKIGLLEITLPAGLKAIGNNAFRGCFALRNEVTIPAGVQTIGSYAFSGCRNAKFNPALPETLTAIGDYAFQNCANLYAVTLPASLQTIGEYAFYASSIQEIVLPEGLFSLGDGAFWFCKALETADFVNSMDIISIPSNAFNGCSGLRKVYLPFFVEEIGDYAFSGCKSLKSLNFFECEEITKIGEFAFRGCRSLKSLDLFKCENLTTIGSRAFSGCTSLKSLNLPKSLETIGEYAFSGCQAISVISSPSLVPPTIASESALNGIDKDVCVLTMPKSVYLDYFRAPYWGQFVEYTASVLVGVDGQGSVMYSNNFGTAPTPVKVAAFYATAGEGDGVEEDEGDGITAEAYDSANICAKDNSTLTFRIVPDEGNEIKSVTYAGEDVTAQVVDGLFTTPVINGDTNLDVSFVASTDYIAIPASAVSKGAEVVVPVELVNTTEVMGIECKVQIPEGFSVAKKADGSLKVEQTERKADQTLTAAVDGNVLTVKTNGTQAYTGNTGAVFTIAIAPDEATAPADYVLKVTDVKFVNATGVASRPDAKTTLTLRDYVLGDVDSDQLVAINDAVIVMNHIVGADTPAFNAKAADMDGNGSVEINDAVLIMNTVVGTESTKSIKKTSATEPNADELTAADIEICQGGTAMLSLDLANLDALTAAQFEITLPEGITAGKAEAGERASRHMIKTNMVGNVLKVAMLSAESADFEGSEGAILVLPLSVDKAMPSGSYGISLRNVKMSDARGNLFILPDADSSVVVKDWSGVDSVAFDRLRVYGGNGEICIESPADTVIQIVAVDGRAFAVEASAGKTAVAVSAGVYVVNGQKVIVK